MRMGTDEMREVSAPSPFDDSVPFLSMPCVFSPVSIDQDEIENENRYFSLSDFQWRSNSLVTHESEFHVLTLLPLLLCLCVPTVPLLTSRAVQLPTFSPTQRSIQRSHRMATASFTLSHVSPSDATGGR